MDVVVVTGSRAGNNRVYEVLKELRLGGMGYAILGDARGVDAKAREFCDLKDIPYERKVADWKKNPRTAGILRNLQMLSLAKMRRELGDNVQLVAFPRTDVKSSGTAHCTSIFMQAGFDCHWFPSDQ